MTKAALTLEIKRLCPEVTITSHNNGHRTIITEIIDPVLGINEKYNTKSQKEAGEMLNYIYNQVREDKE